MAQADGFFAPANLRFLFRTDEGRINRSQWFGGVLFLTIILGVSTTGWALLSPFLTRDLTQRRLIDPLSLAAGVYSVAFVFVVILVAVSWTNLAAKRFRDRSQPAALAVLLPLAAFVAGAAHVLIPRVGDVVPGWSITALNIIAALVASWTLVNLSDLIAKGTSSKSAPDA